MLDAFTYGVPPHGGIAPGIDRFLMAATGEQSLREFIAFPMTSSGTTAVMDAPTKVTSEQLRELKLTELKLEKLKSTDLKKKVGKPSK